MWQKHLELLYHVTEDDSVLGSIERSRAHQDQILHRSGMIFLIRSDHKVLLQRRSRKKATFPDYWDSSSSSMSPSEKATNKRQNVNSKKRLESRRRSHILESSHITFRPRTRWWQFSSVRVTRKSQLIKRNHLKDR